MSADKAREVLDLIRGRGLHRRGRRSSRTPTAAAAPVDREAARTRRAANAEHNDGLDPSELYVATCYADEGATLKRWRPRARGRATRIRKRTCHITIILARHARRADRPPPCARRRRGRRPSRPPRRRYPSARPGVDRRQTRRRRGRQPSVTSRRAEAEAARRSPRAEVADDRGRRATTSMRRRGESRPRPSRRGADDAGSTTTTPQPDEVDAASDGGRSRRRHRRGRETD